MNILLLVNILLVPIQGYNLGPLINPVITGSELTFAYTVGKSFHYVKNLNLNSNVTRKIVHVSSAPLFISTWSLYNDYNPNFWASLVPLSASLYIGSNSENLTSILSRSGNKDEIFKGPLIYTLVLTFLTYTNWLDTPNGVIAMTQLAVGDGFSDLIGRKYGKTKWIHNRKKSIEGSLGFLGTSLISTILFLNYFNFDYSLEKIFIISLICSLIESLPKIDDNLSVPLVALLLCNFYY